MPIIIGVSVLSALGLLLYVFLIPEQGIDAANLESARKNGATLFGCMAGLCLVYPIDRFLLNFKTSGTWYAQLVKVIVGLGLVLLAKEGLRTPLEWLFGNVYVARTVRYFIVVAIAGVLWPLSFRLFSRWRVSALDRFTEKLRHSDKT